MSDKELEQASAALFNEFQKRYKPLMDSLPNGFRRFDLLARLKPMFAAAGFSEQQFFCILMLVGAVDLMRQDVTLQTLHSALQQLGVNAQLIKASDLH